jgi:hypothetical protein
MGDQARANRALERVGINFPIGALRAAERETVPARERGNEASGSRVVKLQLLEVIPGLFLRRLIPVDRALENAVSSVPIVQVAEMKRTIAPKIADVTTSMQIPQ